MKKAKIFETNIAEKIHFVSKTCEFKADNDGQESNIINIYDEVKYQKLLGFGGAFTESSAINFSNLSKQLKKQVLDLYFDEEKGIGYNFCRSTINSCDFSVDFYSYDDTEDDFELKDFSISHDLETIIPMIKKAKEVSSDLLIYSSPWSPPAWMKTNKKMSKGGSLRKDCQDVYARYLAKFIKEYEKEGVNIWGITIQNEAKAAQGWESCVYTAADERDFAVGYLKPTYEKCGLGDKKIMFWDHNKERIVDRSLETLCNKRSRDAFDGIAFHWYSGDHFTALDITHDLFPEKFMIASEQCKAREIHGTVDSGEKYAHDIFGSLNHWATAWVDWNMLLDENGMPDHWVDEQRDTGLNESDIWLGESPIIIDKTKHELLIASSYYYMGHFSKFIKRDAVRIGYSCYSKDLECTTFQNPNGEIILVVMNPTDKDEEVNIRYKNELLDCKIKSHCIITVVI